MLIFTCLKINKINKDGAKQKKKCNSNQIK